MSITRYKATVSNLSALAHGAAHPDGEFVRYSDYEALERTLESVGHLLNALVYQHKGVVRISQQSMGAGKKADCTVRFDGTDDSTVLTFVANTDAAMRSTAEREPVTSLASLDWPAP